MVTHFSEEDVSLGWELFFDRLFEEQVDFVWLELHTFDHNVPDYQQLNSEAFSKLVVDIQEAYQSKILLLASCFANKVLGNSARVELVLHVPCVFLCMSRHDRRALRHDDRVGL